MRPQPFTVLLCMPCCIQAGYKHRTLELLLDELEHKVVGATTPPVDLKTRLSSLTMLEFGNQRIHDFHDATTTTTPYPLFDKYGFDATALALVAPAEPPTLEPTPPVRPFFEHLGLAYVSVDYNGVDGSLKLDVRGVLRDHLGGNYSVITNIGFSEHVGEFDPDRTHFHANQYVIFKNFHDLGHAGTVYFHEVPTFDDWHMHGVAGYDVAFFEALVRANGYVRSNVTLRGHHGLFKRVVVASYVKGGTEGAPFMSLEDFAQLPGLHARYDQVHQVQLRISGLEDGAMGYYTTADLMVPGALASESKVLCDIIKDPWPTECVERTQQILAAKLVEQKGQFYGE